MSQTKIELEYPYSNDWKFGYLVINPEGRRTVILYNSHSDRSSTSYARYLSAVRIGRYLTSDEESDHRDNNKTNDNIDNLQILSPEGNQYKQINNIANNQLTHDLACAQCENTFTFTERELKHKERQNVANIFCSRSCAATYHGTSGNSKEMIREIKRLREEGGSSYSISKSLGISRNTVMKYW